MYLLGLHLIAARPEIHRVVCTSVVPTRQWRELQTGGSEQMSVACVLISCAHQYHHPTCMCMYIYTYDMCTQHTKRITDHETADLPLVCNDHWSAGMIFKHYDHQYRLCMQNHQHPGVTDGLIQRHTASTLCSNFSSYDHTNAYLHPTRHNQWCMSKRLI